MELDACCTEKKNTHQHRGGRAVSSFMLGPGAAAALHTVNRICSATTRDCIAPRRASSAADARRPRRERRPSSTTLPPMQILATASSTPSHAAISESAFRPSWSLEGARARDASCFRPGAGQPATTPARGWLHIADVPPVLLVVNS